MQEGTPIKIDHLGAKNCVAGSCHLMQIPGSRGRKKEIKVIEQGIDDLSWGFEYGEVFSLKKGIYLHHSSSRLMIVTPRVIIEHDKIL